MRISDWSSDVCSSDLTNAMLTRERCQFDDARNQCRHCDIGVKYFITTVQCREFHRHAVAREQIAPSVHRLANHDDRVTVRGQIAIGVGLRARRLAEHVKRVAERRIVAATCARSEEHTSELQSLMRITYDVYCLKKK